MDIHIVFPTLPSQFGSPTSWNEFIDENPLSSSAELTSPGFPLAADHLDSAGSESFLLSRSGAAVASSFGLSENEVVLWCDDASAEAPGGGNSLASCAMNSRSSLTSVLTWARSGSRVSRRDLAERELVKVRRFCGGMMQTDTWSSCKGGFRLKL